LAPAALAWIQEVAGQPVGELRSPALRGREGPEATTRCSRLRSQPQTEWAVPGASTAKLIVAVPGIGRMAERRIVPGLLRRLDIEAQAINDQL